MLSEQPEFGCLAETLFMTHRSTITYQMSYDEFSALGIAEFQS